MDITPSLKASSLVHTSFNSYLLVGIPIAAASYTSHIVIPSLRDYFDNDIQSLKKAIVIGAFLPFLFYGIWEMLILGSLPSEGANSILAISAQEKPLPSLLQAISQNQITTVLLLLFQLFALITSFFGLSLSLRDFFRDGLQLDNSKRSRIITTLDCPSTSPILSLIYQDGFKKAIDFLGAFVVTCFVIIPAIMSWRARYIDHIEAEVKLFGGKPMLIFMGVSGVFILLLGLLMK